MRRGEECAWGSAARVGLAVLTGAALVYPYFSLREKTDDFNPPDGWTLDGGAYLARWAPDELAGIRWLQNAPSGTIVINNGVVMVAVHLPPGNSEYAKPLPPKRFKYRLDR